jgi:hypothetical protein
MPGFCDPYDPQYYAVVGSAAYNRLLYERAWDQWQRDMAAVTALNSRIWAVYAYEGEEGDSGGYAWGWVDPRYAIDPATLTISPKDSRYPGPNYGPPYGTVYTSVYPPIPIPAFSFTPTKDPQGIFLNCVNLLESGEYYQAYTDYYPGPSGALVGVRWS